jgi:hypothetical protein
MKFDILILTQPSRERYLARLLAVLKPQIETRPDVQVVTRIFSKSMDLGSNRQAMIDASDSEYSAFCDDDDLVDSHYVDKIYPLLDGVDYIGFRLQLYVDGSPQKPTVHSLRYKEWNADKDGFYRDISHLNPIRRELAIQCRMSGGPGEDDRWATAMRAKGIVKTEHFVDSVLYYYFFRTNKNDNIPAESRLPAAHPRPVQDPMAGNFFPLGNRQKECPRCKSTATSIAGGMRICNQCNCQW